jgi:DNA-binding MarR family transcriptional regulator
MIVAANLQKKMDPLAKQDENSEVIPEGGTSMQSIPVNNFRTLLRNLSEGFDLRLDSYRVGTRYENVRRSDVRVFFLAMRETRTISDLARIIGISRQAVQKSVQRLVALNVLGLQDMPGNKRDKLVVFTDRGKLASKNAVDMIGRLEEEVESVIGSDDMDRLRDILTRLDSAFAPESLRLKQKEKTPRSTRSPGSLPKQFK